VHGPGERGTAVRHDGREKEVRYEFFGANIGELWIPGLCWKGFLFVIGITQALV